ncbi:MAG TPA: hypothetical protein VGK26_04250 [Thermoanaerobaculia bacterium]|jgi:hypothetical protein
MKTPKSAPSRPWFWVGLCIVLAAGVSVAGAARKASPRAPGIQRASAASDESRGAASSVSATSDAHADRDVCEQQLD